MNNKTPLRSGKIHWDEKDQRIKTIIELSNKNGIESLNNEDKNYLITELDRRLIQFWDKVQYENNLSNREILYGEPVVTEKNVVIKLGSCHRTELPLATLITRIISYGAPKTPIDESDDVVSIVETVLDARFEYNKEQIIKMESIIGKWSSDVYIEGWVPSNTYFDKDTSFWVHPEYKQRLQDYARNIGVDIYE